MTKPEVNIKCEKCGHEWFTESKLIKLNCPSCRKTTTNTTLYPKSLGELARACRKAK